MTPTTSTRIPPSRHADDRLFASALRRAADDLLQAHPPEADPEPALRLIDAMGATLDRMGATLLTVPMAPDASAEIADAMVRTGQDQARLRAHVGDLRFRALQRSYVALDRIRDATSVAELVRIVPAELCAACGFDRSMVSRINGATWIPTSIHVVPGTSHSPSAEEEDAILGMQIPLRTPLVEAEIIRRGLPVLVEDPFRDDLAHQPLVTLAGTREYAVVPVHAGGRPIGFLHADNHWSRRRLAGTDLENLRSFAEGVGLAVERIVLNERLETQRRRVREALEVTMTSIDGIGSADIQLSRRVARREPVHVGGMARIETTDADIARDAHIHGLLTPRERDVLERMARGATNGQIADELIVGVSTVKSHVKHILRKLKARNRAEAVSRYLRLADDDEGSST